MEALKLNIGAGDFPVDGYTTIDRKEGREAYPLDCEDNSVGEILASHVLEHFSHRDVGKVIAHWVQKLAPGGRIRIAVPDFLKVAQRYVAGEPINVQGFVMGGHDDADDHHGALFDTEALTELMLKCGLERIGPWKSEANDCASYDISLNLQGFKPLAPITTVEGVTAILSAPRFGPIFHARCAFLALGQLGINYQIGTGAYWHQVLTGLMEDQLAMGSEFILTLDYDTIFRKEDVLDLYRLMKQCPEADAICALQMKRAADTALFSILGEDGKPRGSICAADLGRWLLPVSTGHFGLTMIRTDSLRKLPRPWMLAQPNTEGRWNEDHTDADVSFWKNWTAAGLKLFLSPRIAVGHLQEVVTWPSQDLTPVHQSYQDFDSKGPPMEAIP